MEIPFAGEVSKLDRIRGFVPGDVQRNGRCGADEFKDCGAVLEFFVNLARLTRYRETCEARPSCSHTPRRNCHAKGLRSRGEILDVDVLPMQFLGQILVIFGDVCYGFPVVFSNETLIDFKVHRHCHLRKPSCNPPSTGSMWPVVLDNRFETKREMASA